MERYGKFMVYTHDEMLDKHFGPKGTPVRDAFDAEVEKDALEYRTQKAIERAANGLPPEFTDEELTCDDVEEELEVEMEMA